MNHLSFGAFTVLRHVIWEIRWRTCKYLQRLLRKVNDLWEQPGENKALNQIFRSCPSYRSECEAPHRPHMNHIHEYSVIQIESRGKIEIIGNLWCCPCWTEWFWRDLQSFDERSRRFFNNWRSKTSVFLTRSQLIPNFILFSRSRKLEVFSPPSSHHDVQNHVILTLWYPLKIRNRWNSCFCCPRIAEWWQVWVYL
jgi:hypothetical protein